MRRGRHSLDKRSGRAAALAVIVAGIVALVGAAPPAPANWLSKLSREAGEAGGRAGRLDLGALDDAARHVRSLPSGGQGSAIALAAHATPEGHWKFVNRADEVFTAGTPDEMKRVAAQLAPEAAGAPLHLHLTDDTVFRHRAALKDLPPDARLFVVVGRESYPLSRRTRAGSEQLVAEVRRNVVVVIGEKALFKEAIWQLSRRLETSRVRVLSLAPGGPDSLKAVPRYDAANKTALVDEIDPESLARSLSAIRGQTAVVTGRIEGGALRFRTGALGERSVPMAEIERAAAAADVDLVVLQSATPAQPGGRNWLWQRFAVEGLSEGLKRATFADFLDALGAGRGELAVEALASGGGRARLRVLPDGRGGEAITGQIGEWMSEIVSNVTGNVVTSAVEVMATSEERQRELDLRLIPGLPSLVQIGYLASIAAGVAGLGVSRDWWRRIWPAEDRAEYRSVAAHVAARAARLAAFVLLFLPVAGIPAFATSLLLQLWAILTAPVRAVRWLAGRWSKPGRPAGG